VNRPGMSGYFLVSSLSRWACLAVESSRLIVFWAAVLATYLY
jgi:hypothetical protein